MYRWLAIFSTLVLGAFCVGAGKKHDLYLVTFHVEGEQTDNPKMIEPVKLGTEHRQYFFSKIPIFTDHDIEWFYPFTSRDGKSFGTAFKLKDHAIEELRGVCLTNQGKLLGARVSNSQIQAVIIDRPVDDGIVVVWQGLSQDNLKKFRKRFPHVDDFRSKLGPEFAMPAQ